MSYVALVVACVSLTLAIYAYTQARRLRVALQAAQDEITDWALVADGVKHDWRCDAPRHPCMRCRLEMAERALERCAGRVVPPDWHGPAEDF